MTSPPDSSPPFPPVANRRLCACVWRGKRCDRLATQEDLLCNWCGNDRREEQLRLDPKAMILPNGTFMGIGGGGPHDGTFENPGACWYPDSGRVVAP